MTEKEVRAIIDGLSDEAACRILEKAMRRLSAMPEPDWSRTEGGWQRAVSAGLTDGSAPERPARRDEVAAMLSRLGLI